jgi:hypothetical protein
MKTLKVIMTVICLLVIGSVTVSAEEQRSWTFEVTPYVWTSGIDGKISRGDVGVDVKQDFGDLVSKLDFAFSAELGAAYKDKLVVFSQFDYLALSEKDNFHGIDVKLSSDSFLLSGAVGYRFPLGKHSKLDVMLGTRYMNMQNKFKVYGHGSQSRSQNILDGILMVRPSIQLSEKWRFNPTLSIGAGDSDLVYELSPQFEYAFNDKWNGRIGYRRLYYDYKGGRGFRFEGAFSGLMLGIGAKF